MKRLVSGFYPVMAGALLATTLLFAGASLYLFNDMQRAGTEARLRGLVRLLAALMDDSSQLDPDSFDFNSRLAEATRGLDARFTVIDRSGRVLAETEIDPSGMENHAGRPEFAAALEGRENVVARRSDTLGSRMVYAAAPVLRGGSALFAVRAAKTLGLLAEDVLRTMFGLSGAMALLLAGMALFIYRSGLRLARPLEALCRAAERFAAGELSFRASEAGPIEIASLARGMNGMAADLAARMQELDRRRTELQTILDGMGETLILLDSQLRIRLWNPAAARLFRSPGRTPAGESLEKMTRSSSLGELARSALESGAPIEEEITLFQDPVAILQARATLIRDGSGSTAGVLLVLNDITRITRLETIRRDFVSNVSHELKTPVTSIKGFVETLKDGALDDPKAARRFLEIIERQTGRLEAIIDDLLSLARIEQGERIGIAKSEHKLRPILEDAAGVCERKARSKKMKIRIDCQEANVVVNANLLEQAVINLIDNAVKFSPEGTPVDVSARLEDGVLEIKVRDRGRGIPAHDLPRLFERFYVVDKARSRELGGTGLGLSIVRHIALVHGGTVTVESWEDSGSTFTISLPV